MSLKEYRTKRDFSKTSEPAGNGSGGKKQTGKRGKNQKNGGENGPIFVVQEHHATRLHYDFRLEVDGVLKSWAVTKEPTLDPSIRRLAVEVEDHPIGYAEFSGDIPEGEYGAGHVEIWDHGTYRAGDEKTNAEKSGEEKKGDEIMEEGFRSGHLEFYLEGDRLKGGFALIRMGKKSRTSTKSNWLLIKKKDEHAVRDPEAEEEEKEKQGKSRTWHSDRSRQQTSASATKKGESPDQIEFTHVDRMMFPDVGVTKGDLLDYYDRIAEKLLPHLQNRPMTLERLPDGLDGEDAPHFWQKNTPDYYPDWIPRVTLENVDGTPVDYVLVNDRPTLLYLVNQGTITFHPWMSRLDNLNHPDYVLFDLDPGESGFDVAVTVARRLHQTFEEMEIPSYVKTSGKSGLHVLVPWNSDLAGSAEEKKSRDDDVARSWSLTIAESVADELSEIATVERSKAKRKGRLYIDVMQNVRGHHAVPPYVVRATPQATISTPLRWSELTGDLDPTRYRIGTIFRRLGHLHGDPMDGLVSSL